MNLASRIQALRQLSVSDLRSIVLSTMRDRRFRLRAEVGLAVALTVGLFLSIVLLIGISTPLDPLLNDLVYQPMPPSGQVAIIAIDKKSLDDLGPWPWPRTIHSELLNRLSSASPRAIAFDILLAQPAPEDSVLASALTDTKNVQLATVGVQAAAFPGQKDSVPKFDVLLLPAPDYRNAAAVGHRMINADADGILRRVPVAIGGTDNTRYPALGLGAVQAFLGNPEIKYDLPNRTVALGGLRIPVDENGRMLINFTSPRDSIAAFSYSDVLRGRVPTSTFANKIVFIGGTGNSESETFITPLGSGSATIHNVLVQADIADMLLHNPPKTLHQQGAMDQIAVTLLFVLVAGLTLPHLRPLSAAALTIMYLLGLLLFAFDAFNQGLVIRILFPALALILCFLAISTFRYLSEERRRYFLTSLFRRYVPADSVSSVVDAVDRGELPLKGTRRMVTVLYCDLRGFSGLSEGLAPEAVLELVNHYLELMMIEIQAEAGTVSKPMGDALVAIWNAPLDQPDHAARGARAAVNVRRSVLKFQKSGDGDPNPSIGLGLATGPAILGNINTLGKIEYTLIGETVNVAQRIGAFAGNNQILTDTYTTQDLGSEIEWRELSPIRIRGRREPLPIWELKDTGDEITGIEDDIE